MIELIRRHHKSGKSLQDIADWLNQNSYMTKRGQQWQRVSVKRVLDRLYGRTPRLSGFKPSNHHLDGHHLDGHHPDEHFRADQP